MSIVSVSLDDPTLSKIDKLVAGKSYSGRSELIRNAIGALISQHKQADSLRGTVQAVLILVGGHEHQSDAFAILHQYEPLVKTQIHSQLQDGRCLQMLLVEGEGSKVRQMLDEPGLKKYAQKSVLFL